MATTARTLAALASFNGTAGQMLVINLCAYPSKAVRDAVAEVEGSGFSLTDTEDGTHVQVEATVTRQALGAFFGRLLELSNRSQP
jgi:hypothetical protein